MSPVHDDKSQAIAAAWQHLTAMVWETRVTWRRDVSEAAGLPFSRTRMLRRLEDGPKSLKQLAELTGNDAPATTVGINALEDRGLVERRPHPSSRRSKLVHLTEAGQALLQHIEDTVRDDAPEAFQRLSRSDLEHLQRILGKLEGQR
ncbi:MarR family winged helix-turn-helix transcriptional regulator [Frateuria aurantia]